MRPSQKMDYAFRAMLELALREDAGEETTIAEVARRAGVPEKFLEAILRELAKAGLLRSRRGPDGGYRLARPSAQIRVGDIWEAVEGPVRLAPRDRNGKAASRGREECIAGLWSELENSIQGVLDGITLEELRHRAEPVDADLSYCI